MELDARPAAGDAAAVVAPAGDEKVSGWPISGAGSDLRWRLGQSAARSAAFVRIVANGGCFFFCCLFGFGDAEEGRRRGRQDESCSPIPSPLVLVLVLLGTLLSCLVLMLAAVSLLFPFSVSPFPLSHARACPPCFLLQFRLQSPLRNLSFRHGWMHVTVGQ
jgi:hypothetical protein